MAEKKPKLTVEESEAHDAPMPDARASEDLDDGMGARANVDRTENPFGKVTGVTSRWLTENFPGHENAVFGGICGLIVALLVFVIGFWQALFLSLCVIMGVAIGQYVDGNPVVVKFVRRIFGDGA